jgi:hypothetical protein
MSGLSFRDYIAMRRASFTRTGTEIGKYLEAARTDPKFLDVTTRHELDTYRSTQTEIDLVHRVWRQYKLMVKRLERPKP